GIRDKLVTGVQTCALPISREADQAFRKRRNCRRIKPCVLESPKWMTTKAAPKKTMTTEIEKLTSKTSAEKQRSKFRQVATPDHPGVVAGRLDVHVLDILGR